MTTATTRVVFLLGDPVAHSISPQLHTAAFDACGIDAVYVACAVTDAAAAVDGLSALGALGANITVPHKRAVWEHVARRTPEAELVGAANTLFRGGFRDESRDGAAWVADNTDAVGVQRVLIDDVGLRPADGVVVFGAGGAARAAAVALGRIGVRVRVEARRSAQAAQVQALAQAAGADDLPSDGAVRLLINATPLGLHGEALPERYLRLAEDQLVLDLVYGPRPTPLVALARERGLSAWDGLGMLIAQAAVAFERWTGRPAPLAVMQRAAQAALHT